MAVVEVLVLMQPVMVVVVEVVVTVSTAIYRSFPVQ